MRFVALSDHAGDMLADARRRRAVAEGRAAERDRRGGPPNVQLTEPLAVLEEFLAKRGQPVRMQPAVLLNHPKARIDRCAADTGVLVLTSTAQLVRLALGTNAGISGSQLA